MSTEAPERIAAMEARRSWKSDGDVARAMIQSLLETIKILEHRLRDRERDVRVLTEQLHEERKRSR